MRSLSKTSLHPIRATLLGLGFAFTLASAPAAHAAGSIQPAGMAPIFAQASAGWTSDLGETRQASRRGRFDHGAVLTLILTALTAIAVVRVAEHRNRPGQDR